MAKTKWPAINARVWLRLPCCEENHPSRVEDFEANHLVISTPMQPHSSLVLPLDPDQRFSMLWAEEGIAFEAPVCLLKHVVNPLPHWTLQAVGEVIRKQRRSFVRLRFLGNVQLHLFKDGPPILAETVDLSEGGLRCRLDKFAPDPGDRVFPIDLSLGTQTIQLLGEAVWWGDMHDGARPVGIKFVETNPAIADAIRSYIFRMQRELRQRRYT